MTEDIFRPRSQPARRFYDAFMDQSRHRNRHKDWDQRERLAVLNEAVAYCRENDLVPATMEDVEKCQTLAYGHTDYAGKWALGLAELIAKVNAETKPETPYTADQILKAAVNEITEKVADLIYSDPHKWSKRGCQTCTAITALIGRPFGCDRYRLEP